MIYTKEEIYNLVDRHGNINLRHKQIKSFPYNFVFDGCIDLSGTRISSLPNNFTVGKGLYLNDTPLASIPDNLIVGKCLDISNTAITSLPDNFTVGGWLDLRNTKITSLPDNLVVGGSLDLRYTPITTLPDNLIVGGDIYANFDISKFTINHLKNGEYEPHRYIYANKVLTHIIDIEIHDEYTYYIGKIPNCNVLYNGTDYVCCADFESGVDVLNGVVKKSKRR